MSTSARVDLAQCLLETAPDGVVLVDAEGLIRLVNRQTETLFGYERSELLGRPAAMLIPEAIGKQPALGAEHELHGRRRDGQQFPVDVALSTMVDADGQLLTTAMVRDLSENRRMGPPSVLATIRDVTDRHAAEKSEFLSRMSHEFRTPLNAVLGFAQMLELDELTDEQGEAVDQIVRAGQHLLELVNEVLDIARIESGRLAVASEPVSLTEVLGEVKRLIEPLARARQITVSQGSPERGATHVLADRQRLKQVFLNILSNAVKYNRVGGRVDLDWSLGTGPPGAPESSAWEQAGQVRISVRDTGPGIAADKLPRLFDPFDRLGAEKTEVEGSGIGLAITLRLVEAMHGDISVASVPEQGTTVTVALPRALADDGAGPPDRPAVPEAFSDGREAQATLWTALYLEGNVANLRLMEHIFARRPGWQLLHALHGSLGVLLARSQRPDVILLDLHLSDLPGHAVLAQLRNDPATRHIPVYIVAADANPAQRRDLEQAGVEGFLTKPVSVAAIYEIVDHLEDAADPCGPPPPAARPVAAQ